MAGLASAVLYTLTNISLRQVVAVDPFMVAAVKAAPTVLTLGPIVIGVQRWTGAKLAAEPAERRERRRKMLQFVGAALVGQVIGNGAFQIALGVIGLAASVPITLGSLLIGSAVMGRFFLGEPVSVRKACSIATLMLAVVVLSQSKDSAAGGAAGKNPATTQSAETAGTVSDANLAPDAAAVVDPTESTVMPAASGQPADAGDASRRAVSVADWTTAAWWGAVCAAMSGFAYAFFSTKMRQTMQGGLSSIDAMWVSGIAGSTALWSIAITRGGLDQFAAITMNQWQWMAAAGVFNFAAFVSISTALRVLPVVAVHLLNASQVAMAAVAGVLLFDEKVTGPLAIGILLTMVGLLVLAKRPETPSAAG